MTDQFQTGICSGNWWDSARNVTSSPCSSALTDMGISYAWPTEMVEMKPSSCQELSSVSVSSIVYQDTQRPPGSDSVGGGGEGVSMDSSLQMMGFSLSSPTTDWSQALYRSSGRSESNFQSIHQEDLSLGANFRQDMGIESAQVHKEWSPKNYSGSGGDEDSSINVFKQINQVSSAVDQQGLNYAENSSNCTVTCQGLPLSFPIGSASASTLLQGLFESDPQPQQINYSSTANYGANSNELSPSWQKFPQFLQSPPSKQQPINHLQFSNNTPFWNASASMNDVQSNFYASPTTQFLTPNFDDKPNCSNLVVKPNTKEVSNSSSVVKKSSNEATFKRPRIQTPSPVPTFKVRKEKLGDRITALQQLVSPFGKTDTASVLLEAIEYIKFLHDQVNALSTPYMKNGAPLQYQQNSDKSTDPKGPKQDLRSRGLCLVPISSTFAVTNETSADLWTPHTFGGNYR